MRKTYQIRVFLLKKGLQNRSFALMPQPSFLSLMKEKKAKENQGLCRGQGSKSGTCRSPRNAPRTGHISVLGVENGAQKKDAPQKEASPKHINIAHVA